MRSNAHRRLYPRRDDGLPCRIGVKIRRLCFSSSMRTAGPIATALHQAPLWQSSRPTACEATAVRAAEQRYLSVERSAVRTPGSQSSARFRSPCTCRSHSLAQYRDCSWYDPGRVRRELGIEPGRSPLASFQRNKARGCRSAERIRCWSQSVTVSVPLSRPISAMHSLQRSASDGASPRRSAPKAAPVCSASETEARVTLAATGISYCLSAIVWSR